MAYTTGSTNDIIARGVTTDDTSVFVTGYSSGDIGLQMLNGATDVFLARFAVSDRAFELAALYGNLSDNRGHGISTDGTNLYITGNTQNGLKGAGGVAVPGIGGIDSFLMKTDVNGVVLWTKIIGTSGTDLGRGVTVDINGDIYITGYTLGSFTGTTNAGGNDLFVTKYDNTGTTVWTAPVVQQLGAAADDTARAIATYTVGMEVDVLVVGETAGALDGNVSFGLNDFFAVNYDGASGAKN